MKNKIIITILSALLLIVACLYLEQRPLIQKMNGQTFGIPNGWHLVYDSNIHKTIIEKD